MIVLEWHYGSPDLPGEYLASWQREDGRLAVTQLLYEGGDKERWTLRSGQHITRVYAWARVPEPAPRKLGIELENEVRVVSVKVPDEKDPRQSVMAENFGNPSEGQSKPKKPIKLKRDR